MLYLVTLTEFETERQAGARAGARGRVPSLDYFIFFSFQASEQQRADYFVEK